MAMVLFWMSAKKQAIVRRAKKNNATAATYTFVASSSTPRCGRSSEDGSGVDVRIAVVQDLMGMRATVKPAWHMPHEENKLISINDESMLVGDCVTALCANAHSSETANEMIPPQPGQGGYYDEVGLFSIFAATQQKRRSQTLLLALQRLP